MLSANATGAAMRRQVSYRRGMVLVELLGALMLITTVAVMATSLIVGTNRASVRIGQWTTRDAKLTHMLRHLREDMADAVTVRLMADASGVVVERADGETVTYRGVAEHASRQVTLDGPNAPPTEWPLEQTTLTWSIEAVGTTPLLHLLVTIRPDVAVVADGRGTRVLPVTLAPGWAPVVLAPRETTP